MRIFNVDPIAPADASNLFAQFLPGEEAEMGFRAAGTTILFTSRRILVSHVQILLTERLETTSFSYRHVSHFALVEGVAGESRSEIKVWLTGDPQPLHLRSDDHAALLPLSRLLAGKLL